MAQRTSGEDRGARLVERLRTVRRELAAGPVGARRAALKKEISGELGALPSAEREAILERALGVMRPAVSSDSAASRTAGEALADLKARHEALSLELESLRKERATAQAARGALESENAKLRADLEAKAASGTGGSMAAFRAGLKASVEGKQLDPDTLGLAPGDVRLFRLTREMVNFVYMLEIGRMAFLKEVQVGRAALLGTQFMKDFQQQVRKRVLAVLQDEPGSMKAFSDILKEQTKFVTGLPAAFQESFPAGTEAILHELDPETLMGKHRGKFMTDYEKAWNDFVREQGDLKNLAPDELWDRFFRESFQKKLGEWTGSKG
jgi:hypothetical protein